MIENYQSFITEYHSTIADEWHFLFDQYAKELNIKNQKTAVNKLKLIFEATFSLSQQKGFQAMTLRDLSQETGISMGGLYTYFKNKEQIAQMIHGCLIKICERWLGNKPLSQIDADKQFDYLVKLHLFLSEKLKKFFYFAYMECKHLDKKLMHDVIDSERHMESKLLNSIMLGIDGNWMICQNPQFTAAMVKSMLQDWYLKQWKYQQRQMSVDQYCDELLCFLSKNLRVG
ncbi:MAG: TetR/AcrR family transcriptional regulator [Proteobacteria bacterium]|nr:TetR/AcrR family transcriptional regulator [Pseudomonadota bacterium]